MYVVFYVINHVRLPQSAIKNEDLKNFKLSVLHSLFESSVHQRFVGHTVIYILPLFLPVIQDYFEGIVSLN